MAESKIPKLPASSKPRLKPPSEATSKPGTYTASRLKASSMQNLCQVAPPVKVGSRKVNVSPKLKTTSAMNSRQVSSSVTVGTRKPMVSSRTLSVKSENSQPTATKRKAATACSSTEVQHGGKRPHVETNQSKRKIPAWDTKALLQETQKRVQFLEKALEDITEDAKDAKIHKEQVKIMEEEMKVLQNSLSVSEEQLLESTQKLKELCDMKSRLEEALQENEGLKASLSKAKLKISELMLSLEEEQTACSKLRTESDEQKIQVQQLQNEVFAAEVTRKYLHNKIQDLKGKIRVFCRLRPKLKNEDAKGSCNIEFPDDCTLCITDCETSKSKKNRPESHEFSFDRVFPPSATQEQIFGELSQLVQSALDGFNVCVFAYGQTGSGKTYTMEGDGEESKGMIQRSIETIFNKIEDLKQLGWSYEVHVSMIEIYNEQIKDLLNLNSNLPHEIRMKGTKSDEVFVTNAKVEEVTKPEDVYQLLEVARKNRSVAATVMNQFSSRSHAVTSITINGTNHERNETCCATLNLVDLAGSEKYQDDNLLDRKKEANNINKSLSNLGRVILALLAKESHIPYRGSKLTHLLQSSLGGNSKTLMLVHISPLEESRKESITSLRFASKVNKCKMPTNLKRKVASIV